MNQSHHHRDTGENKLYSSTTLIESCIFNAPIREQIPRVSSRHPSYSSLVKVIFSKLLPTILVNLPAKSDTFDVYCKNYFCCLFYYLWQNFSPFVNMMLYCTDTYKNRYLFIRFASHSMDNTRHQPGQHIMCQFVRVTLGVLYLHHFTNSTQYTSNSVRHKSPSC